ncbi:MAG: hypothetical protein K0U72_03025 [Gammaproteobacteria bacterium]|nr:hypothetical protein [Gammaproteobacteria bacterium]
MQIPTNENLRSICREISDKEFSVEQWAKIESSDMFQSDGFCGGFDADERAFLFSWYAADQNEYWFQLSIELAESIATGESPIIEGRLAQK